MYRWISSSNQSIHINRTDKKTPPKFGGVFLYLNFYVYSYLNASIGFNAAAFIAG
jgi:hypothetical protein